MRLCLLSVALVLVAGQARADEEPPAEPLPAPAPAPRAAPPEYGASPSEVRSAPPEYTYEPLPIPPPLGHRGFQMAFRTGLAFPIGNVQSGELSTRGDDLLVAGGRSSFGELVGPQLPLMLDIGGKPNKHVFIGGYIGLGLGLAAGALQKDCERLGRDCRSLSFRLGAQIHYAIAPDDRLNPWVGYGLGIARLDVGDGGFEAGFRGFDFGRFMAGLDIRLSRTIGLGPYIDYTVGKYAARNVEASGAFVDRDIDGRTFHYWLTIGPRLVLLP